MYMYNIYDEYEKTNPSLALPRVTIKFIIKYNLCEFQIL